MPQEIKVLLVGVAMLLLVIPTSLALVMLEGVSWWSIFAIPTMITLSIFMPAELPEDASA